MISSRQSLRSVVLWVLVCALPIVASATETVRFTTDWVWQSVYTPYIAGVYLGFYAEEGLSVTVDRGYGSADAATKIASGVYDMGVVDLGVLIEFNSRNPGNELTAVAIIYNFSPLCIMTLARTGIRTPKDLEGRTIAAPAGAAARVLFPAFAELTGIDVTKVTWVTVTPALREPMLVRGEVDATAPFLDALLTLKLAGVPEEEIVVFHYPEYGLDLYGLAVVARRDLIAERPQVVQKMVKAIIRSWLWAIENPDELIDILLQVDPLIDPKIEKERFHLVVNRLILTPEVYENGFGYASHDRLLRNIEIVSKTLALPRVIPLDLLFTWEFLPPLEERLPRK